MTNQLDLQALIPAIASAVVSVASVVTSAVIQLRVTKRESDRVSLQNEHLQKMEKLRSESELEKIKLEKNMAESSELRSRIWKLYSEIVNSCFSAAPIDTTKVHLCAIKLIGLCPKNSNMEICINHLLYALGQTHHAAGQNQLAESYESVRYVVEQLGTEIFKAINPSETAQSTSHSDTQPQPL